MTPVTIYTDGAAINNPAGPAAWAWWISERCWARGGWNPGSNQRAEMIAVLEALMAVPLASDVTIVSDSRFVIEMCETWLFNWQQSGWRKRNKERPLNFDIVLRLYAVLKLRQGKTLFRWVKGHGKSHPDSNVLDIVGNHSADQLASAVADCIKKGNIYSGTAMDFVNEYREDLGWLVEEMVSKIEVD